MRHIVRNLTAAAGLMTACSALAVDMPPLAKLNNCVACHAIDTKVLGPAWMDVSRKYKGVTQYTYLGKEYPLRDGLILKVSKGGAGNWGTMPMPANAPATKDLDIRELVQFILGLAQ